MGRLLGEIRPHGLQAVLLLIGPQQRAGRSSRPTTRCACCSRRRRAAGRCCRSRPGKTTTGSWACQIGAEKEIAAYADDSEQLTLMGLDSHGRGLELGVRREARLQHRRPAGEHDSATSLSGTRPGTARTRWPARSRPARPVSPARSAVAGGVLADDGPRFLSHKPGGARLRAPDQSFSSASSTSFVTVRELRFVPDAFAAVFEMSFASASAGARPGARSRSPGRSPRPARARCRRLAAHGRASQAASAEERDEVARGVGRKGAKRVAGDHTGELGARPDDHLDLESEPGLELSLELLARRSAGRLLVSTTLPLWRCVRTSS